MNLGFLEISRNVFLIPLATERSLTTWRFLCPTLTPSLLLYLLLYLCSLTMSTNQKNSFLIRIIPESIKQITWQQFFHLFLNLAAIFILGHTIIPYWFSLLPPPTASPYYITNVTTVSITYIPSNYLKTSLDNHCPFYLTLIIVFIALDETVIHISLPLILTLTYSLLHALPQSLFLTFSHPLFML